MNRVLKQIVSGGQTGVDRAALDAARAYSIPCAGWCPSGRWAEDGRIDSSYPLRETPPTTPSERTAWNVRDSDATLAVAAGKPEGGTALAVLEARRTGKPVLIIDVRAGRFAPDVEAVRIKRWLDARKVKSLNVAGPRESEWPGAYDTATDLLNALFSLYH